MEADRMFESEMNHRCTTPSCPGCGAKPIEGLCDQCKANLKLGQRMRIVDGPNTSERAWEKESEDCDEVYMLWPAVNFCGIIKRECREYGIERHCLRHRCPRRDNPTPVKIDWWSDFGHKCQHRVCWHKTNDRNECHKDKPVKGVYPLCKQETCPRGDDWRKLERAWLAKNTA